MDLKWKGRSCSGWEEGIKGEKRKESGQKKVKETGMMEELETREVTPESGTRRKYDKRGDAWIKKK